MIAGEGAKAEALARQHITQAAAFMIDRLRGEAQETPAAEPALAQEQQGA